MSERKVTVIVTQTDIDEGRPGNVRSCPVALALRRAMPDANRIDVLPWLVNADGEDFVCRTEDVPAVAAKFISDFDCRRTSGHLWWRKPLVQPFTTEFVFDCQSHAPVADQPATTETQFDKEGGSDG